MKKEYKSNDKDQSQNRNKKLTISASSSVTAEAKRLTPDEVEELLEGYPKPILVDVRNPNEFQVIRIAGAINVPLDNLLAGHIPPELMQPERTYLFCCRTGRRAQTAANLFLQKGYPHVFNAGGVLDWPFGLLSD